MNPEAGVERVTEANNNTTNSKQPMTSGIDVFANDDNDDDYSVVTLARDFVRGDKQKRRPSDPPSDFRQSEFCPIDRMRCNNKSQPSEDEGSSNSGDSPTPNSDTESIVTWPQISITGSSFEAFAMANFTGNATPVFSCGPLQQPLLQMKERGDYVAALACWVTILRIMGDAPDIDYSTTLNISGSRPDPLSKVKYGYIIKYTKKDVDEIHAKISDIFRSPSPQNVKGVPFMSNEKDTMLEKVQFVCMLGIFRRELRDEIYCQICKQLCGNPHPNSVARGWVLLALCAGCFGPSDFLTPHIVTFLRESLPERGLRCEQLVRGTLVSGTRGYPPSWLEFQATKNNKPVLLPVTLMNSQRFLIQVDPFTTVNEFCRMVATKANLKDRGGFSTYITLFRKISCLGNGQHRILDAIAECEQYTKQMGMRESSASWRLYFRKEMFAPWQREDTMDDVMVDLVYRQISRGIMVGEYKCCKQEDIVRLAAMAYYIDHPDSLKMASLNTFLSSWLPEKWQETQEDCADKVAVLLQKNGFYKSNASVSDLVSEVKRDVICHARLTWGNMFSRCYDLNKFHGPSIHLSASFLLVNCQGLFVMEDDDKVLLTLFYVDIYSVTNVSKHVISMETLRGDQYEVTTLLYEDLYQLVNSLLEGLRVRSHYGIIVKSCSFHSVSTDTVSQEINAKDISEIKSAAHETASKTLVKGNVVLLSKAFGDSDNFSSNIECVCLDNDQRGLVEKGNIYILPTAEKPHDDVLRMVTAYMTGDQAPRMVKAALSAHTIEDYARAHFKRRGSDNAVISLLSKASFMKRSSPQSWAHTPESMKEPLLKAFTKRGYLVSTACDAFNAMLQYAGEISRDESTVGDVTLVNNSILEPAIRNRIVRDEVFCQLIKQLTNNSNKTRNKVLGADDFVGQYMRTEHRAIPPLFEGDEGTAASTSASSIPADYIPQATIAVTSLTRCCDITRDVTERLSLSHSDEFGLFYSVPARVIMVPENEYLFDFVAYCLAYWSDRVTTLTAISLCFMKKLWFNSKPGECENADTMFHYHQEVPNYLMNYHKCPEEDASRLAACIFIAKYGNNCHMHLSNIRDHLDEYVPSGLIHQRDTSAWVKGIETAVAGYAGLTSKAAKIHFLTTISKLKTYGCVFFEVKTTSDKFPTEALLAVSTSGLHLINKTNQEIFKTFVYSKIPNWQHDAATFTFLTGDSNSTEKIVLDTTAVVHCMYHQGQNIDRLMMDYITWLMNYHMSRKKSGQPENDESEC